MDGPACQVADSVLRAFSKIGCGLPDVIDDRRGRVPYFIDDR
jgi:hypothetical protein